jgi:hypothetical protein
MTKPKLLDTPPVEETSTAAPDPAAPAAPSPSTAAPDPFDIASLRLNPSFVETAGVKKLLTTVPVKRPSPQDFFRVHPAPEYRENFATIELKDDREVYLVHPTVLPDLTSEVMYSTVFTVVNRQGVVSLWPIRLPASNDRKSEWPRSAREAAELAMTQWVRLQANMSLGAYEISVAQSVIADPAWPALPFAELVRIGFGGRIITTLEHPVIKRLRGLT